MADADLNRDGVEEGLGLDDGAVLAQAGGEGGGRQVHPLRDGMEALGAVEDGVERRHDREQRLGGADVGRGLLAANVLLTGLESQSVGAVAVGVLRDTDEPAGHDPLERICAGEEGGVRPAEAHRDAEALRRTDRDVGAHGGGLLQQTQGQQIRRHDRQCPCRMQRVALSGVIAQVAVGAGVGEDGAEQVVAHFEGGRVALNDLDADGAGPGGQDGLGLWVQIFGDEELLLLALSGVVRHGHGLGCRRRLV